VLLSGSVVAITYIPAVVAFLDIAPSQTPSRAAAGPSGTLTVMLVMGAVIFGLCAVLAAAILAPREKVSSLRQAVDDTVRGRSSSDFTESLEIGARIAAHGIDDTGWHERKTCNAGPNPLLWRTLGIGSSDRAAYQYRRFVLPRVSVTDGQARNPAEQIFLAPIGRPLQEGTNPLLEYAVFFEPPITSGETLRWRVEFSWPHFNDLFRQAGRDNYEAAFSPRTTEVRLVVSAPWPLSARFVQSDLDNTTVSGIGEREICCSQSFQGAAPASARRRFRVETERFTQATPAQPQSTYR
jgi:hypothetical protein